MNGLECDTLIQLLVPWTALAILLDSQSTNKLLSMGLSVMEHL